MKRNKYLENIGIKRENYGHNFVKNGKIGRFIERRKYGFDHRETMHMDVTFAEWIYGKMNFSVFVLLSMHNILFSNILIPP